MNNNQIRYRRKNISLYLDTFFPNVITQIIKRYDYYFEGKSLTFVEKFDDAYFNTIEYIARLPNGKIVTAASDIRIWNPLTGNCELKYINNNKVYHITITNDGRIVGALENGTIRIWNPQISSNIE